MKDLEDQIEKIIGIELPNYDVVYIGLLDDSKILIICIQTNCETPNGINTDEVIENYMKHNYPTKSYEILDDWLEHIVLREKDIWEIPTEF